MGNEHSSVTQQVKSASSTESTEQQSPIDSSLLRSLEWRLIGPFRGGRVVAVAGDPVQPLRVRVLCNESMRSFRGSRRLLIQMWQRLIR